MRIADARPDGRRARYFGVYPAIVTDIVDPDSIGPHPGEVPVARRRRRATCAHGRRCARRTPTTIRASRFFRRSTRRSWWRSRRAISGGRTSSAPVGTDASRCPSRRPRPTTSGCGRRAPKSLLEFDDTDGAEKVTLSMRQRPQARAGQLGAGGEAHALEWLRDHVQRGGQIQIQANATVEITASALNVHCADGDVRRVDQLHDADRVEWRGVAVVHARRGEYLVTAATSARAATRGRSSRPWWKWPDPADTPRRTSDTSGDPEVRDVEARRRVHQESAALPEVDG